MTSKELFLRDEELFRQWGPVVSTEWFSRVMMHAMAALIERSDISPEQIKGAKALQSELMDLGNPDQETMRIPQSGLHHNIDKIILKDDNGE